MTIAVPPEREEAAVAAAALCGTLGAWCERPGVVRAYFDGGRTGLERAFAAAWREVADGDPPEIVLATVPDVDWLTRWRESARPLEAAPGVWVTPPGAEPPAAARESGLVVMIQPGQGFGTGSHPTTRALLRWVAADPTAGDVLDVGTGSGILALAALGLGARRAIGLELDPAAVENAVENRALNDGRLGLVQGSLEALREGVRFDRVLANLDRATLGRLAPALAGRVAPGGRLGVAGLLEGEQAAFLALAADAGLALLASAVDPDPASGDGWWSGWLAG